MTTPKKSTAKKAATKVAAKRAARPEAVTADEVTVESPTGETITFMGRTLAVKLPTAEQLVAWDSLTKRVQRRDPETVTMADAVKFTGQLYTIIESVIADPEDLDWLWELRANGEVGLEKASEIITEALKAFKVTMTGEPENRAARRAKA